MAPAFTGAFSLASLGLGRRRKLRHDSDGEEEAGGGSLLEWLSVFVQHSSCWEHDYTEAEGEWLRGNAVEGLLELRLRLYIHMLVCIHT